MRTLTLDLTKCCHGEVRNRSRSILVGEEIEGAMRLFTALDAVVELEMSDYGNLNPIDTERFLDTIVDPLE